MLLVGLLVGVVVAGEERMVDQVAAVVGDDIVVLSEIYDIGSEAIAERCPTPTDAACRSEAEIFVLDALIRRTLMRQELAELGLDVGAIEVDRAIQQVIRMHDLPDRETLRHEVEATGISWETYRQGLEDQLRVQQFQETVLRNRITTTDDEIQDLYQRTVRDMKPPDVVRIAAFGYVLPSGLPSDQLAAEVMAMRERLDQVRRGELPWALLAEQYDTAKVARLFEGQTFAEGDLLPALSAAAFTGKPGQPSDPVMIGNVLYGVFVLAREPGRMEIPPLEAVRDSIEGQLFEEKLVEAEDAWYASARRRTAVRILIGDPEKPAEKTAPPPAPTSGPPPAPAEAAPQPAAPPPG